jgi:hypothetical protein
VPKIIETETTHPASTLFLSKISLVFKRRREREFMDGQ